jgi:hypothetical protein
MIVWECACLCFTLNNNLLAITLKARKEKTGAGHSGPARARAQPLRIRKCAKKLRLLRPILCARKPCLLQAAPPASYLHKSHLPDLHIFNVTTPSHQRRQYRDWHGRKGQHQSHARSCLGRLYVVRCLGYSVLQSLSAHRVMQQKSSSGLIRVTRLFWSHLNSRTLKGLLLLLPLGSRINRDRIFGLASRWIPPSCAFR